MIQQFFTSNQGKNLWVVDTASELASIPSLVVGDLVIVQENGGSIQQWGGATWATKMGGPGLILPSMRIAAPVTFTGTGQAAATDVTLATLSTLPANYLVVGNTWNLKAEFDIDLISSATARNLVWKLKVGATVLLTWTMAMKVSTAKANTGAFLTAQIVCHAIGASGVIRGGGAILSNGIASAAADSVLTANTPVAGVTVNTTQAQAVTLTVNESVNSVADIVRAESAALVLAAA